MNYPAIVVIAYNRKDSLKRLLSSLERADYPKGVSVPLIISIDKGDNAGVIQLSDSFIWSHGVKTVIKQEENLGLKKHVIKCGCLTNVYDSIIMLEDDLYVSKAFYYYACDAMFFVKDNDKIAGVSLYDHRLNVHVREPFQAYDDGYDNYYFQFASSWGQAYSKDQWALFSEWYVSNADKEVRADNVPENVYSWSDKSWLKYYIKYLIDTDRYFLYPRISYTTNFSDEGTHALTGGTDLQVPLAIMNADNAIECRFSTLDESRAIYDAFFENTKLEQKLPNEAWDNVTIDLYGYKPAALYNRFILSRRPLPYRILESFGRTLRPIDSNIVFKIEGKDYFLYDTEKPGTMPKTNDTAKYLYIYRAIKAKEMKNILKYRIKEAMPFHKKKR